MDLSEMFKYEEQENRKYLVYEKRESDVLDTFMQLFPVCRWIIQYE